MGGGRYRAGKLDCGWGCEVGGWGQWGEEDTELGS